MYGQVSGLHMLNFACLNMSVYLMPMQVLTDAWMLFAAQYQQQWPGYDPAQAYAAYQQPQRYGYCIHYDRLNTTDSSSGPIQTRAHL